VLVAFPELGLTAYTCDDLFRQEALLDAAEDALYGLMAASRDMNITMVVGLPMRVNHQLFNVAAVVAHGELQGVVPKMFLPNYGEFYEARYFAPADSATVDSFNFKGQNVPFGTKLLFDLPNVKNFKFNIEICEDVWTPLPPSTLATLAGATVLINLSASNALVGKSGYRHDLVAQQSARCLAAYLYTSAGAGESTTDLAWDGQSIVYEKGDLLVEAERFIDSAQIKFADIDLDRLIHDRIKTTTFSDSVRHYAPMLEGFRTVNIFTEPKSGTLDLDRNIEAFPFVPADPKVRDVRCTEVYNIQVQALTQRMAATGIKKLVIGVSGGLDSTHALLVCVAAMDRLNLPRTNILGYTMPGFATSGRTLQQAHALMDALNITSKEVDIKPSCLQMLKDLDHPFARGEEVYDITFENVQAGERTNHLFRYANHHNGMVVGTGDLSELALGWCTYGVGDHMSHYNVNGSVPKTLMQYLVRWVAEGASRGDMPLALTDDALNVLLAILNTEISPELIPSKPGEDEAPSQSTESSIGPYELQDFTLHYVLRYGFKPSKIVYLAHRAWGHKYSIAEIKKYMKIFMFRFFQISQFKRTCVPNGPKVGNGGSLSPRGDWRAPSDAVATVWLAELDTIPDNM
jgi:NAD+ synthase (glutamine-hydrolysing)